MRIGFWKEDITPPVGVELGGYAGYRPCTGVHDPLWCRAVVLEQDGVRYALLVLDLMCADEAFCGRLADALAPLEIRREHLVVSAIHSHSAPCGVIPGEGLMAAISLPGYPGDASYFPYLEAVLQAAYSACEKAVALLEPFVFRYGSCPAPMVGSERHTGGNPQVTLTAIQCRTDSGRNLILYHFPAIQR